LSINYFLVPHFGMTAAAWATTLAYGTMAFLLFVIVQRTYRVPYEASALFRIALAGGGCFGAWYALPGLQVGWIELLLLIGYLGALFLSKVLPWRFIAQRLPF
jgi:O-antigen/teichoic acid export membrane protein